jgi:hypothetical protein
MNFEDSTKLIAIRQSNIIRNLDSLLCISIKPLNQIIMPQGAVNDSIRSLALTRLQQSQEHSTYSAELLSAALLQQGRNVSTGFPRRSQPRSQSLFSQ